jgi:hypothetical protein
MSASNYIGPDPVKWLDRLIDVNASSEFHPTARAYIDGRLRELREKVLTLQTVDQLRDPFDTELEAKACTNELFYRNGPTIEDIRKSDAQFVKDTIERCLREAFAAGRVS